MKRKIIIIEDEKDMANLIGKTLEDSDFEIEIVNDGSKAMEKFYEVSPHLVLLDINLPHKNGWEICGEIREVSKLPIIIMTARDTELDEIHGLELGADDYITKPISLKVLMLKIKKLLKIEESAYFTLGDLNFDYSKYEVEIRGEKIKLTKREALLLEYLFRNSGLILKRETLLNEIWGYEFYAEERAVDTLVARLRKKLGEYGDNIKSIRGVGYVFEKSTD